LTRRKNIRTISAVHLTASQESSYTTHPLPAAEHDDVSRG